MQGLLWIAQALSGVLLVILLGLHLVANHTESGMLTYEGAVQRFKDPALLTLETTFLVVVIFHAFNGVRNVLLDYVKEVRWQKAITRTLTALGAIAAGWGIWLGFALHAR